MKDVIGVVVVNMQRLLDESDAGRAGAAQLQAMFDDKKAQHEALRSKGTSTAGKQKAQEAAAAFQAEAITAIEQERARLRTSVLAAFESAIRAEMKARGAVVVVDSAAAVAFDAAADITDAVLSAQTQAR